MAEPKRPHAAQRRLWLGREGYRIAVGNLFDIHEGQTFEIAALLCLEELLCAAHDGGLQAGPVRLRPIVMTTLAMVLGMLPVAFRIGRSAEMRAPMAVAVIGGLILSTLLTLLVIPVVYTLFDDLQSRPKTGDRVQP